MRPLGGPREPRQLKPWGGGVATEGIFDNSKGLRFLLGGGVCSPYRAIGSPYWGSVHLTGLFSWLNCRFRAWRLQLSGFRGVYKNIGTPAHVTNKHKRVQTQVHKRAKKRPPRKNCDHTSPIQNTKPLRPKMHPEIHLESPSKTEIQKNTKNIRKLVIFVYIFRFFCISVLEGDSRCISGCIWGFGGVLYFVWGTYDHNVRIANNQV